MTYTAETRSFLSSLTAGLSVSTSPTSDRPWYWPIDLVDPVSQQPGFLWTGLVPMDVASALHAEKGHGFTLYGSGLTDAITSVWTCAAMESDRGSIDEQRSRIDDLLAATGLSATLVYSGGKSIHIYMPYSRPLYAEDRALHLRIVRLLAIAIGGDHRTISASRRMRLGGVVTPTRTQTVLATHTHTTEPRDIVTALRSYVGSTGDSWDMDAAAILRDLETVEAKAKAVPGTSLDNLVARARYDRVWTEHDDLLTITSLREAAKTARGGAGSTGAVCVHPVGFLARFRGLSRCLPPCCEGKSSDHSHDGQVSEGNGSIFVFCHSCGISHREEGSSYTSSAPESSIPSIDWGSRIVKTPSITQYLRPEDITTDTRITIVRAPMGSGKTEAVKAIIDPDGLTCATAHRSFLATQMASRLGLPSYADTKGFLHGSGVCCVDSIRRMIPMRDDAISTYDLMIVDEAVQVLGPLSGSEAMSQAEASTAREYLSALLQTAKKVVLMDADFTPETADIWVDLCGASMDEVTIVDAVRPYDRKIAVYHDHTAVIDHALRTSRMGYQIAMYVESKNLAETLQTIVDAGLPSDADVMVVDGQIARVGTMAQITMTSRSTPGLDFDVRDIDRIISQRRPRALIYTQVAGSGVSITIQNYFYAVYGILYGGTGTVDESMQGMMRVRHPITTTMMIGVKKGGSTMITDPDKIVAAMNSSEGMKRRLGRQIAGLPAEHKVFVAQVLSYRRRHGADKSNKFRALCDHLFRNGWSFCVVPDDKIDVIKSSPDYKATKKIVKAAGKVAKSNRNRAIVTAYDPNLDPDTQTRPRSIAEVDAITASIVASTMGRITEDSIEDFESGVYRHHQNLAIIVDKESGAPLITIPESHEASDRYLAATILRSALKPILPKILSGEGFEITDEDAEALSDRVSYVDRVLRADGNSLQAMSLPVRTDKTSARQLVSYLLRRVGLRQESKQIRTQNGRTRIYMVTTDCIQKAFAGAEYQRSRMVPPEDLHDLRIRGMADILDAA